MFQLASNSNSDAIFLFLGVDLYNRISFFQFQNSKNDINKKFVTPNVHRESISLEMQALGMNTDDQVEDEISKWNWKGLMNFF